MILFNYTLNIFNNAVFNYILLKLIAPASFHFLKNVVLEN